MEFLAALDAIGDASCVDALARAYRVDPAIDGGEATCPGVSRDRPAREADAAARRGQTVGSA